MQKSGLVKSSNYAWVVLILLILMQFVYAGLTLSTVTLYMNPSSKRTPKYPVPRMRSPSRLTAAQTPS